jgi:hypothetical protein
MITPGGESDGLIKECVRDNIKIGEFAQENGIDRPYAMTHIPAIALGGAPLVAVIRMLIKKVEYLESKLSRNGIT